MSTNGEVPDVDLGDGFGRMSRDLRAAAATLGLDEVRYLVDSYYQLQDFRQASGSQKRALAKSGEPHATVAFFFDRFHRLEKELRGALDVFSQTDPMGRWSRQHVGVGPVIAAGLSAHIDIERAPTVGHIWRFAGLDPSNEWKKGEKRPWNAELKTLCWKLGDSFVKHQGREGAFYGQLYVQRKALEVKRDMEGRNAATAAKTLKERTFRDAATRKVYESGHLPAGRLDLRARRVPVKLFLAHWHEEAYRQRYGTEPPAPYPIAHLGHAHKIEAPV